MRDNRLWIIGMGLGVASVVLLRVDRSHSLEAPPESLEHELRYVCVGDVAVELGAGKARRFDHELKLELPFDNTKHRCRPPRLPKLGASPVSVTAPARGYGAVLEKMWQPPKEALEISQKALEGLGWRETDGSKLLKKYHEGRPAAAYERDGAWLLTVALSGPNGTGSMLLLAGDFGPAGWSE
jgi:hypothetical protein